MISKYLLVLVLLFTAAASCDDQPPQDTAQAPYRDASLPVAQRVADLMSRMSLADKLGQMTQAERGSITPSEVTEFRIGSVLSGGGSVPRPNDRGGWVAMVDAYQRAALATPLGIPFLYGADAVHGHNNVAGATVFPHNIGLGATRDADLVIRIGQAVAQEVAETGVHWTFAPCLCVARDDRWGRTYESFSEDPAVVASMSGIITGIQSQQVMATAKHYLGDGGTTGGKDQGDTQLSLEQLRAIHLPPFEAAVKRDVASVMVSFSSWNGDKVHGSEQLITKVLKDELKFGGFVVSDWNGMDQIDGVKGLSAVDVRTAINAGIDMAMVPQQWGEFLRLLKEEVDAGRVTMARIDDANRRILTKKIEYQLFEQVKTGRNTDTFGGAAHRALAREAVAKSQVLLKNSGVLPLKPRAGKLFVAGRSADNTGNSSGGWTLSWQGGPGPVPGATSVLQGIREVAGPGAQITFAADGAGIDRSYSAAIAVIGELPYAEYQGDRPEGVRLDPGDVAVLASLKASGVPVIVVLISGRPMDVAAHLPGWDALVAGWLPGSEGAGVADVLFGRVSPTGKLPVAWPVDGGQPANTGDGKAVLFPLGFGLTY
ncbi:beta-glucosidase [Rhizocola hellebori]|uniref:beta-glucosidase n=1 Tax=Rhizocola hellebori TaxID=1392758 RepID=A0A8J3Q7V2_9ACTN|nr:glycoside hydrolase family 3 protein [Rhizocola hellebori]GIH05639.1 beta-glucosidase [Rhizocola hellebori]